MRAWQIFVLVVACRSPSEAPTSSSAATAPRTPSAVAPVADASVVTAVTIDAAAMPPNTIVLAPVAMAGPYTSIADACHHAAPCGFTDMTEQGEMIKPATKPSCPALENSEYVDPNAGAAALAHRSKELELRIGSQSCAMPKGLRGEQDIYYVFVKRSDGWWRSDPLWQWSYNDKYANGTMVVRWNDQPGRTFAGIAAGLEQLECAKQGSSTTTLELMVRIEPGSKTPVVFPPLVVGQRFAIEPIDGVGADSDCKASKHTDELAEHWTSADDLELSGVATWEGMRVEKGVLEIGFAGAARPSSVGRYRFTR